jgi:hypothetical protein
MHDTTPFHARAVPVSMAHSKTGALPGACPPVQLTTPNAAGRPYITATSMPPSAWDGLHQRHEGQKQATGAGRYARHLCTRQYKECYSDQLLTGVQRLAP